MVELKGTVSRLVKNIKTKKSAYLGGCAGAGEEVAVVVTMYRDVEHVRVLVEYLLRAVTVVHVLIRV